VAMPTSSPTWQRALILLTATLVSVVVIATLYWAQKLFIPLALAIYLAFLLNPLVRALERLRLGRVLSVLLAVSLMALVLVSIGWIVSQQVSGLVKELPQYTSRFKAKIESLREAGRGTAWETFEKTERGLGGEPAADAPAGDTAPAPEKPPAVTVQPESPAWLSHLPSFLTSLAEALGGLALTLVLLFFMLLRREDLRSRLIRLAGHSRLTVTTKAIDDAGRRISRYFVRQAIVNGAFGLTLGIGLFFIGLDYAFLWGFLAAVLRYVPYVGTWIAAILPVTLSLGTFDGWVQPLLVVGLFLAIELICANLVEPRVFGRSMGVSEVALLMAAAFWALLWGPVGLILANPLTVCLLVVGKNFPQLEFFNVLLGDEPALDADVTLYQRLLARDQDEATQLVEAKLREASLDRVFDELVVPALIYGKRDRERDEISEFDERFIQSAIQEIVEDLGEQHAPAGAAGAEDMRHDGDGIVPSGKVRVLLWPARHDADFVALEMLRHLLDPAKWDIEICGAEMLAAELLTVAAEKEPAVVCIGAVPPGGLARSRYLCKRLRNRVPGARIVVGRWGLKTNLEQNSEQLREAGADRVDYTLLETRNHLQSWLPVYSHQQLSSPDGLPHAVKAQR
jgi:predicted PurR-regulated permease PerM